MHARFGAVFLLASCGVSYCQETGTHLPPCPSSPRRYWDNCFGSFTNRAGSFQGEFRSGSVNGFGTFKNKNGNVYSGQWKDAHFDGIGTLNYAGGKRYVGNWAHDKRNGFGEETSPDGSSLKGEWRDDAFLGSLYPPNKPPRSDARAFSPNDATSGKANEVSLIEDNGTFKVPVIINGAIKLDFTVDSGASDVSLPADVVLVMIRTGSLTKDDFLGSRTYRLADGTEVPSQVFRIRTLTVGGRVIENVVGSLAGVNGTLLLGQSFLRKFKSVSFDYQRKVLVLR